MKAIDVDCPTCHVIAGARCTPPHNGAHQSMPGKPDEWKYFHDERIAATAERTTAARVEITKRKQRIRRTRAQMTADVTPNLFVTAYERAQLLALVRAAPIGRTHGAPIGRTMTAKRRDELITKLESVTW